MRRRNDISRKGLLIEGNTKKVWGEEEFGLRFLVYKFLAK